MFDDHFQKEQFLKIAKSFGWHCTLFITLFMSTSLLVSFCNIPTFVKLCIEALHVGAKKINGYRGMPVVAYGKIL